MGSCADPGGSVGVNVPDGVLGMSNKSMHQKTPVAKRSEETPDVYIVGDKEFRRNWHVVDASGQSIGRLADRIAEILMGKAKPTYTPHVDTGDFVVVVNADKVDIKGRRLEQKTYDHYTYHPGGGRFVPMADLMQRKPEFLFEEAVRRMLPKTKMGKSMLRKLKIYRGATHPHQAQSPAELKLA